MTRRVVATQDPALGARVVRTLSLRYADGADAAIDRPAHVRAGSGAVWVGSRLLVVQDDANFVALVDPRDGTAVAVALPAAAGGVRQFDDARGNKADKLDLEAVVRVPLPGDDAVVLAFGSGSTARRESIVALRGLGAGGEQAAVVAMHAVPRFYAALRAALAFAGSELNVEAIVYLGPGGSGVRSQDETRAMRGNDLRRSTLAPPWARPGPVPAPGGRLRLFNRGNGARRDGLAPIDATCDVDWPALAAYLDDDTSIAPPEPRDIVQYDLGAIGGLALTFTDATLVPAAAGDERRRIVYTAAAEASPDATRDGPVSGCAIGVIDEGPDGIRARWALLDDAAGIPFGGKVEGIALLPADPRRACVVVDRDDPGQPTDLCEVVLDGPWYADG